MEIYKPNPSIDCDFAPPPVSLEAFIHYETGVALPTLIAESEAVQAFNAARLAAPTDQSEIAPAEQEALREIIGAVRKCVQYEVGRKPWQQLPKGDCYTFTWLISDIAEQMGLESRIVFCNGHAFNLLYGPSGQVHIINGDETADMWFFDVANNPVAGKMFSAAALDEATRDAVRPSSYWPLNTFDLQRHTQSRSVNPGGDLLWLDDNWPAAAVMTPAEGKRAMFTYYYFEKALYHGNVYEVLATLRGLQVSNPQAETRTFKNRETKARVNPDLHEFGKLVKKWSMDPSVDEEAIVDAILAYHNAMPETKSMCIQTADCLRSVGLHRQAIDRFQIAEEFYVRAEKLGDGKADPTLQGKQRKTRETIKRMRMASVACKLQTNNPLTLINLSV